MDDLQEALRENEELHDRIRQLERDNLGLREARDDAEAARLAATAGAAADRTAAPAAVTEDRAAAPLAQRGGQVERGSRGLTLVRDMTNKLKTDHLRSKVAEGEEVTSSLRASLEQERTLTKRLQEEKAALQQSLSAEQRRSKQDQAETEMLRAKVRDGYEAMHGEREALKAEIANLRQQLEDAHFSWGQPGSAKDSEDRDALPRAGTVRFSQAGDSLAAQLSGMGGLANPDLEDGGLGDGRPPDRLRELQTECTQLREQLRDAEWARAEVKQLRERLLAAEEEARSAKRTCDELQLNSETGMERLRLECTQLREQLRLSDRTQPGSEPQEDTARLWAAERAAANAAQQGARATLAEQLEEGQRAQVECARLREQLAVAEERQCSGEPAAPAEAVADDAPRGGPPLGPVDAEMELRRQVASLERGVANLERELDRARGVRPLDGRLDGFLQSFTCLTGRRAKVSGSTPVLAGTQCKTLESFIHEGPPQ